jgi:hypothetical protein
MQDGMRENTVSCLDEKLVEKTGANNMEQDISALIQTILSEGGVFLGS